MMNEWQRCFCDEVFYNHSGTRFHIHLKDGSEIDRLLCSKCSQYNPCLPSHETLTLRLHCEYKLPNLSNIECLSYHLPKVINQIILDYLPKQNNFLFHQINQDRYEKIRLLIHQSKQCKASIMLSKDWYREQKPSMVAKHKRIRGSVVTAKRTIIDSIDWCPNKEFENKLFKALCQADIDNKVRFEPRDTIRNKVAQLESTLDDLKRQVKNLEAKIDQLKSQDDYKFDVWNQE